MEERLKGMLQSKLPNGLEDGLYILYGGDPEYGELRRYSSTPEGLSEWWWHCAHYDQLGSSTPDWLILAWDNGTRCTRVPPTLPEERKQKLADLLTTMRVKKGYRTRPYESRPGWNYHNDNDGTYTKCDSWADARASVKGRSHDHQVVFKDQDGKEHFIEDGLNLVDSVRLGNKDLTFKVDGKARTALPSTYELDITPITVRCTHTGRWGAGTYSGVVRGDKEEIEKWCEKLKGDYHPAGYGTRIEVCQGTQSDSWYAKYYRYGSCD